jgi:hypothetical protein
MFKKILKWLGLIVVKGKVYEYEFTRGAGQIWASTDGFYDDGVARGDDWFAFGTAKIPEAQSIKPGQVKKVRLIIED